MKNNNVLIIGAGIGGLAAGIRLAAEGFRVRIIEKNMQPGGWLRPTKLGNVTFPNAGNLVTMPQLIDELFASVGRTASDYLTLEEISPIFRFIFPEENEYTLYREPADTLMKNNLFGLQDQQAYGSYGKRSDRILDEYLPKFFTIPYRRSRNPFAPEFGFRALRPGRSGRNVSERLFTSEELRNVYSFWPMFCGGAPSVTTHFYRMIPALMQRWGVYVVRGGPEAFVNALVRLFEECGGEIQYNSEAEAIQVYNGAVTGVRLTDNSIRMADYVISDADTAYTCRELIDSDRFRYPTVEAAQLRKPGVSLFIYHMVLRTPPIEKRPLLGFNVIMPPDMKQWEQELFTEKRLPDIPLFYLNCPDKIDYSFVPADKGALTVICPVPNLDSEVNWPRESYHFRSRILSILQNYFENELRPNLIGERYITPVDLHETFNSHMGAAWCFDAHQERTEVPRLPNRCSDIENLYLVGNGAHPGPFLPGVLQGAEIVYKEIISRRKDL
ncbi:MAG: phytoene desaturase [Anaerolineaceae bacterium]|nr:phytoene desaturase [Anaerolineaceae bacterium]